MSDQPEQTGLIQGTAAVSLVSLLLCALGSEAFASRIPPEAGGQEQGVSARIASVVERIRCSNPALLRALPVDAKLAQWWN
jgi:hypothetical protein